jgi:hypothetical protein
MNRRPIVLLAATLVAAAGGLAGGSGAFAASSGGVSAGPLHWDPSNPATRHYYIPTVAPGATFSDQIRVQNPNDDSVDLYVSAVDGITATPSGAVYANRTDPVTKWGRWLTTGVPSMTLVAHQASLVSFTVKVPSDATPGDHLAGVAFENAHPTPGSGSVSIATVIRTVVGVLIKVPGPASFRLSVGTPTLQPLASQGYASVVIPLEDTGGLLGKPQITVTLDGPNGYHRTLTRQLDTLLPGDLINYPFPWPDSLAAGPYRIAVTGTAPGMIPVTVNADAQLGAPLPGVPSPATPKAAPVDPAPAVAAGLPSWVIPVLVAGSLVLLLALVAALGFLLALMRRQRRRHDSPAPSASAGTPRGGSSP